jgi:DDB1- and CUL4-associated factor 11
MSAAWERQRDGSVVARHEWKGLMKMPGALEDWNEKTRLERDDQLGRQRATQRVPGAFDDDDEEDYDEDEFE